MSEDEKVKLTDLIIKNDENEFLITQTLQIFKRLNNA